MQRPPFPPYNLCSVCAQKGGSGTCCVCRKPVCYSGSCVVEVGQGCICCVNCLPRLQDQHGHTRPVRSVRVIRR